MDKFRLCNVNKYDEKILTLIQQILSKFEVNFILINLDYYVTNKTKTEICSKILKKVFELNISISEVRLFLILN